MKHYEFTTEPPQSPLLGTVPAGRMSFMSASMHHRCPKCLRAMGTHAVRQPNSAWRFCSPCRIKGAYARRGEMA